MIIDAILREIYSINELSGNGKQSKEQEYEIPKNLKRFFDSMGQKDV